MPEPTPKPSPNRPLPGSSGANPTAQLEQARLVRLQSQAANGTEDQQNQAARQNRPLGQVAMRAPEATLKAPARTGRAGRQLSRRGPKGGIQEVPKKAEADTQAGPPKPAAMKSELDRLKLHLRLRGSFWSLGLYCWICFPLLLPVLGHKLYWDREIHDPIKRMSHMNLGPTELHPAIKLGKRLARSIGLILYAEWAIAIIMFTIFGTVQMALLVLLMVIGDCASGISNVGHCVYMAVT